ncbi:MAG: HAD family phosphatase [Micrococcus sp.]|nr:HAD family phosphatase [Micrococcus sp.]
MPAPSEIPTSVAAATASAAGTGGALRAVLWDMDGTLIDTEPVWNAVQSALVADHGGQWSEELAHRLVGQPLDVGARHLQEAGVELGIAEIIEHTMGHVAEHVRRAVPWRPGARDLLEAQAAAGIPGALVTMSHALLAQTLAERAPHGSLGVVVTGDQVQHGKPDPEAYLLALQRLGLPSAPAGHAADSGLPGLLAIEDSPVGVRAARAAGLRTLGVPSVLPLAPGSAHVQWDTLAGRGLEDLAAVAAGRDGAAGAPQAEAP